MDWWIVTAVWLLGVLIIRDRMDSGSRSIGFIFDIFWNSNINYILAWIWPITVVVVIVSLGIGVVVSRFTRR